MCVGKSMGGWLSFAGDVTYNVTFEKCVNRYDVGDVSGLVCTHVTCRSLRHFQRIVFNEWLGIEKVLWLKKNKLALNP